MKRHMLAAAVTAALLVFGGYAAFFVAPDERTMHEIQRIFYFHMPSGITAFAAFLIVFIANIAYLATRQEKWDRLGVAAAEVGVAFVSLVLITGPIWAKPVWGIWWTWDARLTSTFVLWLLYMSYLVLRTLVPDARRRAAFSAIFGIFVFLDVPLVYFSIRIWRTQHPAPVVFGGQGSGLNPVMKEVLWLCWIALMALMALLVRQRYRLESLRHEVENLRYQVESQIERHATK